MWSVSVDRYSLRVIRLSDSSIGVWTVSDIEPFFTGVVLIWMFLLRLVGRHDNDVDVDDMPIPWEINCIAVVFFLCVDEALCHRMRQYLRCQSVDRQPRHNQVFRHSTMQFHGGEGLHLIMILHVFNLYEMMLSECPCVWRSQRFLG
jgi:hypothetical protein